jgi:hypothetical protein
VPAARSQEAGLPQQLADVGAPRAATRVDGLDGDSLAGAAALRHDDADAAALAEPAHQLVGAYA